MSAKEKPAITIKEQSLETTFTFWLAKMFPAPEIVAKQDSFKVLCKDLSVWPWSGYQLQIGAMSWSLSLHSTTLQSLPDNKDIVLLLKVKILKEMQLC